MTSLVATCRKDIKEEVERDILLADLNEWVQNKSSTKSDGDQSVLS